MIQFAMSVFMKLMLLQDGRENAFQRKKNGKTPVLRKPSKETWPILEDFIRRLHNIQMRRRSYRLLVMFGNGRRARMYPIPETNPMKELLENITPNSCVIKWCFAAVLVPHLLHTSGQHTVTFSAGKKVAVQWFPVSGGHSSIISFSFHFLS